MDNKKIGKLIATLRKEQGLTQQQLGDKVGVGFRAVSKWERGINCPDIGIINDLSKILGISSDELLSGEINKSKQIKNKKKISNKIKTRISIVLTIIAICISLFVYYNNKTYVYDIVSANSDDYFVEGKSILNENNLNMTINKINFEDSALLQTIIKGYEYQVYAGNTLIYGYGYTENTELMEKKENIKTFLQTFRINFSTEIPVTRKEIINSDTYIKFSFINEENQELIKEIKIKMYKKI